MPQFRGVQLAAPEAKLFIPSELKLLNKVMALAKHKSLLSN